VTGSDDEKPNQDTYMTIAIDRAFNDGAWTYTDPEEHQFVVTATLMHYPIEAIDNFIELGERPGGESAELLKPSNEERGELLGLRSSALEAFKVGNYDLQDAYLIALHCGCRFYGLRLGALPHLERSQKMLEDAAANAKNPRPKTAPNGEEWTMKGVTAKIVAENNKRSHPLPAAQLWVKLRDELKRLGFSPDFSEDGMAIQYDWSEEREPKSITFRAFQKNLSTERRGLSG
jgi:hypothetical protein